jgi:hypothetical protein
MQGENAGPKGVSVRCALCRSQSKEHDPTKIFVRDLQVPRENELDPKEKIRKDPRELEFKITGKMV